VKPNAAVAMAVEPGRFRRVFVSVMLL
jgi:hypothetical protein